jgi:hypothetical protein
MTIETFEKAKRLRGSIQEFENKIRQIEKMRKREKDEDFNILRQIAFDACQFASNSLEKEFESLK